MAQVLGPLTNFYQMGLGLRVVVLGGGALECLHQGLAVGKYNHMPPSDIIQEVAEGLLHRQGLAPEGGPLLLT